MKARKEVGEEWKALEGIQANSADRSDQLNALRFQMQSVKFDSSRSNSEPILEMKCRGAEGNSERRNVRQNMGAHIGKLKSTRLGNMGLSRESLSRKLRNGIINVRAICLYRGKSADFSRANQNGRICWCKIENRMPDFAWKVPRICGAKRIRTNGTITENTIALSCNCVPKVEF